MKKVHVTFSLTPETQKDLQTLIGKRKMSSFVDKALQEALKEKKNALKQSYIEAAQDTDHKNLLQEWSATDAGDWEW